MTWQCITSNESHCIDRPFEVTKRAEELLIANGWTKPAEHEYIYEATSRDWQDRSSELGEEAA